MSNHLARYLRPFVLTLGLGALFGTAHGGAVSSNFDPQFGPALPNMSYSGSISFNVPDSCLGSLVGVHNVWFVPAANECNGSPINGAATLNFFETGNPGNTWSTSFSMLIAGLKVYDGVVVGWTTDVEFPIAPVFPGVDVGLGNIFGYLYLDGVPLLACVSCPALGGHDQFVQEIDHTDDQGVTRHVTMTLDGQTPRYDFGSAPAPLPEPGSMALVLGALLAGAAVRRRGV